MIRASTSAFTVLLAFTLSGQSSAEPKPWADIQQPKLVLGTAKDSGGIREVGAEGAEWAFPGGGRVIAAPGTALTILRGSQPLNLGRGTVKAYSVALRTGTVRVRVPNPKTGALIVAAPRKVIAVVAEGEAVVGAGPTVAVANTTGSTSVAVGASRHRAVAAGTLVAVGPTGESRRALSESPQAKGGKTVLLSFGGGSESSEFAWSEVMGAGGYLAEVRRADTNHLVLRRAVVEPRLSLGLEPGRYTLRVVGMDPSGIECSRPLERPVHVVSVTLPAGSHRDASGVVRFPHGTKLSMSHTDGVEMAYDGSPVYVAAASELEFLRAESRLVRLRAGAGDADTTLFLMPRSARAEVEFGSTRPAWPGQSLPIRVRLREAGTANVPDWIEARPKVTVGVEPVDLTFTREGDWLTAALPPQPGPGPWVVRVEVADQHGFELGRDFVEITESRPAPRPVTLGSAKQGKRARAPQGS